LRARVADSAGYALVSAARRTDDRLRVLTIARDVGSGYGGAEKVAYEFARRLQGARFKSYLCTTRRPHHTRRDSVAQDRLQLAAEGIEVLDLNRDSRWVPGPWRRVYALLVSERIDIVHAHMPRASVPAAVLARLARVPVVVSHEHGSALEGKIGRKLLERAFVAPLSTKMLAVSEWDRRNIVELEGIDPDKIDVLPNGIPAPPPEGPDVRPEFGVPDGVPLIGAVGRLFPEKGYDDLLRAVAVIRQRGLDLRCLILGDGPQEHELREVIAGLGIGEEVLMPGRRSDVPDVIRALDVAILCSRREGSPLAMLEYMAGGVPIVATAVGGVPELITDAVHGLLVKPADPAELADAVQRLLADREFAGRLGAAAQERQRAIYDIDVVVERLAQLFLELYARSRAARR
jgi:glycosyltransferase involved in cell wall biosynthesis